MEKTKYYYKNIEYTPPFSTDERMHFRFRNWSEFLSNVEHRIETKTRYSKKKKSEGEKEDRFNDCDSLEEALKIVKGEKHLKKNTANEIGEVVKPLKKRVLAEQPLGGVDVATFLSGEQQCFENFVPKNVMAKRLKSVKGIAIQYAAIAMYRGTELSAYLEEVCEYVYKNYRFEKLYLFAASRMEYDGDVSIVVIELDYKEGNYILRAGFADFFRRIGFFLKEQTSKLPAGYGKSLDAEGVEKLGIFDKGTVIYAIDNYKWLIHGE